MSRRKLPLVLLVLALALLGGVALFVATRPDLGPGTEQDVVDRQPVTSADASSDAPRTRDRVRVIEGGGASDDGAPAAPPESDDAAVLPPRTGRLVGAGGASVAGGQIVALRESGEVVIVTVGDDGAFDVPDAAGDRVARLDAFLPGQSLERPVELDPRSNHATVRLAADTFITVTGRVQDTDGTPISDAEVHTRLFQNDGDADLLQRAEVQVAVTAIGDLLPNARTTTDGSFELRVPRRARVFGLVATAPGHAPGWSDALHADPGRAAIDTLIRLRRVVVVSGRVVDADTGAGLSGARVRVVTAVERRAQWVLVTTDAAGDFTVDDLARMTAEVWCSGYASASLELQPGLVNEIRLRRAYVVTGKVVFADGTPVSGAHVGVRVLPGGPADVKPTGVTSSADGTFGLDGLPAAGWRLRVVPTVHAPVRFVGTAQDLHVPGTQKLTIVVETGRAISGQVLAPDGTPVAGVSVWARHAERMAEFGGEASATSGEDGRFTLGGLLDGRFRVETVVTVQSKLPGYIPAVAPDVAAGATDVRLRLELGRAIAGRIVTLDDRPVANRVVLAIAPDTIGLAYTGAHRTKTGVDGRFRFEGLPDAEFRLQLAPLAPDWLRSYLEGAERVAAGARGLQLRLSSGGEVSGVVTDAAGAPLADTEVEVVPASRPSHIQSRARTDDRGRFVVVGLVRGVEYVVAAAGARVADVRAGRSDLRIAAPAE